LSPNPKNATLFWRFVITFSSRFSWFQNQRDFAFFENIQKLTVFLKELAKNQTVQGRFFGFLRTMISRSKNMVLVVLRTAGKGSMYSTLTYPAVLSLKKGERMATPLEDSHAAASSFVVRPLRMHMALRPEKAFYSKTL
jgi:hypothetical protein